MYDMMQRILVQACFWSSVLVGSTHEKRALEDTAHLFVMKASVQEKRSCSNGAFLMIDKPSSLHACNEHLLNRKAHPLPG